jgi:aryl-phospho-beta-D-glucosidase BglC (GH1 family)
LDFAQSHGFNALRMPLAVDNVLGDPEVNKWSLTADPALQGMRSLQVVERIVRLAARRGLLVMLDMHRLRASVWPTTHGLWFDEGMPAERLEAAWRKLARRFCAHWNVVASDLFNEPWGASWVGWTQYAQRLGNLVLEECPRWLVVVEGIGTGGPDARPADGTFCDLCFWGENLRGLTPPEGGGGGGGSGGSGGGSGAIRLATAGRLVFSPHLYGPATNSKMFYFNRSAFPDYPRNLPAVWEEHFLGPARRAGATLLVGEWGGRYTDETDPMHSDEQWQNTLRAALRDHGLSSFYWALNPNSGDTGGLLKDDWTTPVKRKLELLDGLPSSSVSLALASAAPFFCPPLSKKEEEEQQQQQQQEPGLFADARRRTSAETHLLNFKVVTQSGGTVFIPTGAGSGLISGSARGPKELGPRARLSVGGCRAGFVGRNERCSSLNE